MMRCEGTKIWRKEILDKRLRNIHGEVGSRKRVRSLKSAGRKEECKCLGWKR
jgi:hypothetical protein